MVGLITKLLQEVTQQRPAGMAAFTTPPQAPLATTLARQVVSGPAATMADAYMKNQPHAVPGPYVTQLPAADENKFRGWLQQTQLKYDANADPSDYDMRGYWRNRVAKGAQPLPLNSGGQFKFPATFQTPYHSAFSVRSQYALPTAPAYSADHSIVDPTTGNIAQDEHPNRL